MKSVVCPRLSLLVQIKPKRYLETRAHGFVVYHAGGEGAFLQGLSHCVVKSSSSTF